MKFVVIRSTSPYNIILGRIGLRELRAIPSTLHAMMKFPTPRGIATLVTRAAAVLECRRKEEEQLVSEGEEEQANGITLHEEKNEVSPTEEVMIHSAYPNKPVTIGTGFSRECRMRLVDLLRRNKDVFAWQPADMTGVPRFLAQHNLNVKMEDTPIAQKRRTFSQEKNQVIAKEVQERIKAGIVRPFRTFAGVSRRLVGGPKETLRGRRIREDVHKIPQWKPMRNYYLLDVRELQGTNLVEFGLPDLGSFPVYLLAGAEDSLSLFLLATYPYTIHPSGRICQAEWFGPGLLVLAAIGQAPEYRWDQGFDKVLTNNFLLCKVCSQVGLISS
ncbi:reverse transcriptase domain-containing protein [Artemisia annua]|uniref:Reverse transcriptase domain-containing protein n=1 Tax=Artemisia annua TaxID=35608 RepID=A0A2U1LSE6_ARTAN|nr:reverse transcriptase domain-containing protein [Artemisia annua]